jgi:hypothetical protein
MLSSKEEVSTTTTSLSSSSSNVDTSNQPVLPPPPPSKNTTTTTPTTAPIVYFPWRHEEIPLLRLVEGTIEHATQGILVTLAKMPQSNATINALATFYMFLDVPWYELLWYSKIKEDLAQSMSYAWTRGVASLLSDMSDTSDDHIVKDTYGIDFHGILSTSSGPTILSTKDNNNNNIPLGSIFEKKLIELYQNAYQKLKSKSSSSSSLSDEDNGDNVSNDNNNNDNRSIEIRLKIVPYDMEFISLYSIPYLSRDNATKDPHLLSFYKQMLQKKGKDRTPDLNKLRKQYLDQGRMESMVIAQCLVWCKEIFYVRDVRTGEILQGTYYDDPISSSSSSSGGGGGTSKDNVIIDDDDDELPRIPHLVRMEKTVITESDVVTGGVIRNIQSDWIITDIDDLLGGNLVV